MKRTKIAQFIASFALLGTVLFSFQDSAAAGYSSVNLSGSGPVYSAAHKPGNKHVTVTIKTYNNLNVGFDLIDQGNGNVISNGTVKDKSTRTYYATSLSGHSYKLRLRCQEPIWNDTKCDAYGKVSW